MYGPFFEERRLNYSNFKGLERFHASCFPPNSYLPWPSHFYSDVEPQYPYFLTSFGKMYPWPELSPIWGCDKNVFYERPYGNHMAHHNDVRGDNCGGGCGESGFGMRNYI
jgi:hypothetical protein